MQRIIVTLSSVPILRCLWHSFYGKSSSSSIVSSPRGFLSPSFVLRSKRRLLFGFQNIFISCNCQLTQRFSYPISCFTNYRRLLFFHKLSSSAAIISPLIVRFKNGLCLWLFLQTTPIICHLQTIIRLYQLIVFINNQHVVRYKRHRLSPDQQLYHHESCENGWGPDWGPESVSP